MQLITVLLKKARKIRTGLCGLRASTQFVFACPAYSLCGCFWRQFDTLVSTWLYLPDGVIFIVKKRSLHPTGARTEERFSIPLPPQMEDQLLMEPLRNPTPQEVTHTVFATSPSFLPLNTPLWVLCAWMYYQSATMRCLIFFHWKGNWMVLLIRRARYVGVFFFK